MDKNPSTATVKTPSSNYIHLGLDRFPRRAHQLAQPRQRAAAGVH